jgi:cytochrome c6
LLKDLISGFISFSGLVSRKFLSDTDAFTKSLLSLRNECRIVKLVSLTLILLLAFSTSIYALAQSGADTYKLHCAACHGARGAGDTIFGKNLNLRDLRSDEVQKQSDGELAAVISKGKNRMPPFGRKLSAQQIVDVVKYIRSLKK